MAEILADRTDPEGDHLAVTICATDSYLYATEPQARAIHANLRHLRHPITIVLVGGDGMKDLAKLYADLFGPRAKIVRIPGFTEKPGDENYKSNAQLLIAQMRTAAFTEARIAGATHCWSFDSDVIPKTSACYRTLRWILDMPGDYYEVAISPYPSQGGGDNMLTGRGTPENPILQDFRADERQIPPELQARIDANKAAVEELTKVAIAANRPLTVPDEIAKEGSAIDKAIMECQPKEGVFAANAKNWRRRGWLTAAYPGLGRGVVVPSDWCGFGNTLLGRRALDECDFFGYEGSGTEDLFVVWLRWHQVGIRIGSALHEPSHHVSRRKDKPPFTSFVRFVTDGDESKGECVGHLRTLNRPFYAHTKGERHNPANDGKPQEPPEKKPADPPPAKA